MRINSQRMIGVLGKAPKPEKVWERQFDYCNNKLVEMARMDWDKIPDHYLCYYFDDLAYVQLQPDLFRHLFPACLKYWYETLMRSESAEHGPDFHNAMMRGNFVEKLLSENEQGKLNAFFHDGFMDRIEAQNSFKHDFSTKHEARRNQHSWIFRFNTLGIVAPVIEQIWETWWTLDHPGKAFCSVMYISGLIYFNGENPIYDAWTPEKGGGGPYLTETDTSIFDWAWREDNHSYLKDTLSVDYVLKKLEEAQQLLSNPKDSKIVNQVLYDAKKRTDIIECKIGDLVENLAKVQLDKDNWI